MRLVNRALFAVLIFLITVLMQFCFSVLFDAPVSEETYVSEPLLQRSVFAPTPAFADEANSASLDGTSNTASDETSKGDVYVVVAPSLVWEEINNDNTPTLQRLAGNNAVANVISEDKIDISQWDNNPHFHYVRVNAISSREIDLRVESIYNQLKENDSLIVTSSPKLARIESYSLPGYGVLILVDQGDNGLLTSSSTRRSGLITSANLGNAIGKLLDSPQVKPGNLSIYAFTDTYNARTRTASLARENSIAVSIEKSREYFIETFVTIMAITFILSVILLFLDIRLQPAALEHFVPAARILWIATLSIPLATFIMFLQLPYFTTSEIVFDYFTFAAMEIAFTCIIVALVFRWTYALFTMLGLTIFVLIVDQLLGGPMTSTGYLSYTPLGITRYYGIGNEGAALLFGSWITLSALILNQFPKHQISVPFKRWIFPLGTLFIFTVIAAPWWGSNYGVIIWGTVGALSAWSMFNGYRFSWKLTAALFVLASVLAFVVLVLDNTFGAESHLGTYADTLAGNEWWLVIPQVIGNVASLSWKTVTFSPFLSVGFALIMAFMIMILVRKPGSYESFWKRNKAFASGYTALLVTAFLMLLVEDSGILMPALVLLYALAGLLWLVCSSHSWHIRHWMAGRRIATGE